MSTHGCIFDEIRQKWGCVVGPALAGMNQPMNFGAKAPSYKGENEPMNIGAKAPSYKGENEPMNFGAKAPSYSKFRTESVE